MTLAPAVVQLCGNYVVELEGRRVESELPGRQGRMLLAYLVVNRTRAVRRDELIEAIWPQKPPAAPDAGLSSLLSKLRRVLGPATVPGLAEIRLVLPHGARVDVERAVEAVHRAESARTAGDPDRAWGAAYVGFHVSGREFMRGCEAPWIAEVRRQLEDVRVRALESLAECCLAIGGTGVAEAERNARRLVELAPFRETGHLRLMEALEARGNHAEGLLVYERIRCLLRDELGTVPGEALQEAHERLLQRGRLPA